MAIYYVTSRLATASAMVDTLPLPIPRLPAVAGLLEMAETAGFEPACLHVRTARLNRTAFWQMETREKQFCLSPRTQSLGAAGRNRTDDTCLEGRSFAIKLQRQMCWMQLAAYIQRAVFPAVGGIIYGSGSTSHWSYLSDSNRQPADYKSAALPLSQGSRYASLSWQSAQSAALAAAEYPGAWAP